MPMCRALALLVLVGGCLLPNVAWTKEARLEYPPTRKGDAFDMLHGERIDDPYRWLEPNDPAEVVAWDEAQMALLRRVLDAYPQRGAIRARFDEEFGRPGMKALPTFEGGRRWYEHRKGGQNHAVLYVTSADGKTPPRVVLDPNTWSEDGTAGLNGWTVSPDGSFVAYHRDDKGSEDTTIHVRDVVTGVDLPDRITRTKFSGIVWSPDSRGFFYSRMPDPESVPEGQEQYHRRTYFHTLGSLVVDDVLVYGAGRPMLESGYAYASSDGKHVFIGRGLPYKEVETFEVTGIEDGTFELQPLIIQDGSRTWVDRRGDTYFLNTDKYSGTRDLCVMQRHDDGTLGSWERRHFRNVEGVLEDASLVGDLVLGHFKQNVRSRLFVEKLSGGERREIALPSPGTVSSIVTRRGDTRVWFRFESQSTPPTTFVCDLAQPKPSLVPEESLDTSIDTSALVSEMVLYPSKDGTKIPMFILRHKDTKLDGTAPTVLYGYGGFRVSLWPRFSRTRALWAERGGVWCVANLRGGDEFGEAWHEAGCLGNKQNVFDDFIAAADWLVSTGKASRSRLAIQGGSNGGLLTATVANQRPDLCRAVISAVPLTDMLRYHRFQYAKSWTKEYGDPDVEEEFHWIRPYSPYHNVKPGTAYPAMLFTAGLHDGRVDPFHARKQVAVLQAATGSPHPILLRLDRESGHGSTSLEHLKDAIVDQWSFLLMELDGSE